MIIFSNSGFEYLKDCLKEVSVVNHDSGQGFAIRFVMNDGRIEILPEPANLGQALRFTLALSKNLGLEDGRLRISYQAVHDNRDNDDLAKEASDLLVQQGYSPADTVN